MYGGSARFKIGILQSDCAIAVQASAIDLIEYIEKQVKKKINKAIRSCIGVNCTPKKIRGKFIIITNVEFRLIENNHDTLQLSQLHCSSVNYTAAQSTTLL